MKSNVDWMGLAGFFLVVEGVLSIGGSLDQQPISQVGRFIRIGIGFGLIFY